MLGDLIDIFCKKRIKQAIIIDIDNVIFDVTSTVQKRYRTTTL